MSAALPILLPLEIPNPPVTLKPKTLLCYLPSFFLPFVQEKQMETVKLSKACGKISTSIPHPKQGPRFVLLVNTNSKSSQKQTLTAKCL